MITYDAIIEDLRNQVAQLEALNFELTECYDTLKLDHRKLTDAYVFLRVFLGYGNDPDIPLPNVSRMMVFYSDGSSREILPKCSSSVEPDFKSQLE